MANTPRCFACRLPFTPKRGAKNRRCPGCQRHAKQKKAAARRALSLEDRLAAERELRMLARGRCVPSGGEG